MSDYITLGDRLQVVEATNSAGKSVEIIVDTSTGEIVPTLEDSKFPWRDRKKETLRLADVYGEAQLNTRADRARGCSTWLEYLANEDGSIKQLHHFNACKQRLCPLCSVRKARIMAIRLGKVLEKVKENHPDTQLIFLTLTLENCTGDKLRDTITLLMKAWSKLTKRRPFARAVKGWFRALEITRNRSQNTYHPHFHVILVVENAYFDRSSGLYVTQEKWREWWQQCLQVAYLPMVDVRSTYTKDGKGKKSSKKAAAAAVEAAKYACKSVDYISPRLSRKEAAEVVKVYTDALAFRRLTAMGGWVLDASQELAVDVEEIEDLVHDETEAGPLTEETAAMLEVYGWHFGVANHILRDRIPNLMFLGNLPSSEAGSAEAGEAGTVEIDKNAES